MTRIFLGGDRAATEGIASIGLCRKVGSSGTVDPSSRKQMQIRLRHRLCGRHKVVVGGQVDTRSHLRFWSWQCRRKCFGKPRSQEIRIDVESMISNLVFIHQTKYLCYSLGPLLRLRCISVSYSSSLLSSIAKGFVIGWKSTSSCPGISNLPAVAGLDLLSLKILMRWQSG